MRIVTARENLRGAREIDGESQCVRIEIRGIEIKTSQIIARWLVDVHATIRKSAPASIESLSQIGNCSAEVAEHPLDVRVALGNSSKDKLRRRESRVEKKSDERHQPIIRHRFDADWIGRM